MENTATKKQVVKLTGKDGNAVAIIGNVRNALVRAGLKEQAAAYLVEAMAGDYDHLLRVTMQYVDIR